MLKLWSKEYNAHIYTFEKDISSLMSTMREFSAKAHLVSVVLPPVPEWSDSFSNEYGKYLL